MSYRTAPLASLPTRSNEANRYLTENFMQIIPSENIISELSLPSNLSVVPVNVSTEVVPFLDAILEFPARSDDVFICSLPKSGTSWMQMIAWLLKHNLDYKSCLNTDRELLTGSFNRTNGLEKRVDQLLSAESQTMERKAAKKMAWNEYFDRFQSPRVIKSFLPLYFLPKSVWSNGTKIIYIVRNPKDAAVSEFHFMCLFPFNLSIDDIVDGIANEQWLASPRADHILNFWKCRNLKNVLFISYEDLVWNTFDGIKRISEFLECNYTDAQLTELTQFLSFDNMKNIGTLNRESYLTTIENDTGIKRKDAGFKFLRKGKAGTYKDELNENQIKKLDDWACQMEMQSDFKFKL